MAVVKKTRGRVWENQETMLLLQKWGDENTQVKLLSCTRKKPIWQEISAFLRAAGYEDRDEDACKTRIRTLVGRPETELPRGSQRSSTKSMNSYQKNPARSRKLSLILPKLSLGMVQRTVKKKAKEMSKTSYQTCLPAAAIATTTTANARNQKKMLV